MLSCSSMCLVLQCISCTHLRHVGHDTSKPSRAMECIELTVSFCYNVVSMQLVSEEHSRELEVLRKKLRWYTENQQLLDKDSALLKQKDAEISRLADELHQLKTDVSCIDLLTYILIVLDFYRATACNATLGIAVAILSVCLSVRLSNVCIVRKLNDGLRIF